MFLHGIEPAPFLIQGMAGSEAQQTELPTINGQPGLRFCLRFRG